MSNSKDPDEAAYFELSHLDLEKTMIIAYDSEWFKFITMKYGKTCHGRHTELNTNYNRK